MSLTPTADDREPPAAPAVAAGATVVVVHGGEPLPDAVAAVRPPGAYVIAADSGVDHAARLGWPVDLAIGDFDSVTPEGLAAAAAAGAVIERHPAAKAATDLELALDAARNRGPAEIVVVGGTGGRLDHLLAGLLVLTRDEYAGIAVRAVTGTATVHVVRSRAVLTGQPGEVVTLLAVGGPAHGVTTEGLAYPLADDTLVPGSTRGVSNVFTATTASVVVGTGVVLAIVPTPEPAAPDQPEPAAPAGRPDPTP